jgi:hypothetical protein
VSYGPVVNTAAVLLAAYGNVPAERAANLIRMLLGVPVSPGFVDKANARLSERLGDAGFDDAMQAALAAEPALGADETPVNVLTPDADPDTRETETGSPSCRSSPGSSSPTGTAPTRISCPSWPGSSSAASTS